MDLLQQITAAALPTFDGKQTHPKDVYTMARLTLQEPLPLESSMNILHENNSIKSVRHPDYSPLQFIPIHVANVPEVIPALIDSGAETCLANSKILQEGNKPKVIGKLLVKGIIGDPFQAD
jgi:hypothetical protein